MESIKSDNINTQEVQSVEPQQVSQPSSDRFAILARKEKAMRDRIKAIEEQERGFKTKEQELKSSYIPKERLTQDPLSVLSELGISYDKITEQALAQSNPMESHMKSMKEEIAQLKSIIEQGYKQQQDAQTTQYQNALKQIQFDVGQLVESDADFELIKEMKAHDQVVDLIEHVYKTEGRVLSTKEAAKTVEDYLFENTLKAAKYNKISKALAPKQEEVVQQPSKPVTPTLSNNNTVAPSKPLSDKDRIARAIAAFNNKLG